jgi:hypothetical protein
VTVRTHRLGRGAAARTPGADRYWLQVSLEVWLFIVPIVAQVQVIPAPPKFVLWKWRFEAQPWADFDEDTRSFHPLGMLAAEYWNPPLHPEVFETVQVSVVPVMLALSKSVEISVLACGTTPVVGSGNPFGARPRAYRSACEKRAKQCIVEIFDGALPFVGAIQTTQ